MTTVLGCDLGTQGIKVVVYSAVKREVLYSTASRLDLQAHDDGTREQDPQAWISGFQNCLAQIPSLIKNSITAIGVSGQQHGFVPVDADGQVIAPAKLWSDTTTAVECEQIIGAVGHEVCANTVGCITTGFTAPKIRAMKLRKPESYARLRTIMLPHDYLNFYLTGKRVAEYGDASGTGILDIRTRTWSETMLRAVDPDRDLSTCLPDLIEAHQPAGVILPHVASSLGLPENVVVSSGGGDNMMAAIGTGNVVPGRLTASMGTSGTLFAFSEKPLIDPSGCLAAFCSSTGGWLPLLCTMNCTVATEELRKLFSLDVSTIDEMVAAVVPGCHGVITLPFYNGERVPNLPDGKAVIFGLDVKNTTKGHLMRSAMESAIFGLKRGLETFAKHGMHFSEVTITGGGSSSRQWRQICADILDLPVRVLKQTENAAMGAALQALWCYYHNTGNPRSIQCVTDEHLDEDISKRSEPNLQNVKIYRRSYARYLEVLETIMPLFKKEV